MAKPTIDISTQRKRLDDAFSAGDISAREYRRIQKGMSNIAVGQKKGFEYDIKNESRTFDVKKDGQDAKGRLGGVTAMNPLTGRKTSKAITYIASGQQKEEAKPEPAKAPAVQGNAPPVNSPAPAASQAAPAVSAPQAATKTETSLPETKGEQAVNPTAQTETKPAEPKKETPKTETAKPKVTATAKPQPQKPALTTQSNPVSEVAQPEQTQQKATPSVQTSQWRYPNYAETDYIQKLKELNDRLSYINNPSTNRQIKEERRAKATDYRLMHQDYVKRFGKAPEGLPVWEFDPKDSYRITSSSPQGFQRKETTPVTQKPSSPNRPANFNTQYPQGGYRMEDLPGKKKTAPEPIRGNDSRFVQKYPVGIKVNTQMPSSITNEINERTRIQTDNNVQQNFRQIKKTPYGLSFYSKGGSIPKFEGGVFKFLNPKNGMFTQNKTGKPGLFSDTDSAINTGLGIFGAVSGLTNKAPQAPRSERANFRIRPASGDYDTLQRNLNSAEGTFRGTVRNIRNNVGSDTTSYVRGVLGAGANRDAMRNQAYMQDSQIRVQDRQREDYMKMAQDQINNQLANQDIQTKFNWNAQRWSQRAQGAQGMVNSALNFGVQKRANEYNNKIAEKNAMREVGMMESTLRTQIINEFIRNNGGRRPSDEELNAILKQAIPQKPTLFVQ